MEVHIVLFLKKNLNIDFKILVEKIKNSYKDLNDGLIITNQENNPNKPKFIFENNKDLLIDGNNHHISINLYNDYVKIKEDIIEMLWDAFDYCDLEFSRVGYIKEIHSDTKNIDQLKKSLLTKEIAKTDEFQVAYHQLIKFERKNINCWKRFVKFYDTQLIINYDINTKEENIKNINYKLLKNFISFSDKYMEEDIKNLLE